MKKLKILLPIAIFLLLMLCCTNVHAARSVTNVYDLADWFNIDVGTSGTATYSGNTVKLLKDVTSTENMYLYTTGGNDLVLDLNGHSIDFDVSITNGAIWGTTIANFTITDTSGKDTDFIRTNKGPVIYNSASNNTFKVENTELVTLNSNEEATFKTYGTNTNIFNNVKLTSFHAGIAAAGWDKFVLNNVTFNLSSSSISKYGVKVWGHNEITLNNCTYKSADGDGKAVWLDGGDDGKVTINGGSYEFNKNSGFLVLVDKGTLVINDGKFSSKATATVRGTNGNIIINGGEFYGLNHAVTVTNDVNLKFKGGKFSSSNYGAIGFNKVKSLSDILSNGFFMTNETTSINGSTNYRETAKNVKVLANPQSIILSQTQFDYNNNIQKPAVTVKDINGNTISSDYYDVSYSGECKNAGTYNVYVTFKGDYASREKLSATFNILQPVHPEITLSKEKFTYNKKVQKPEVTIKDDKGNTISNSNYDVRYSNSNSKKIGIYFLYVTFKNDYSWIGEIELVYQIVPKGTKLSKVTAGKKKFTAKWKKQTTETTGYQVQYSTKKDFSSGNKTINVKKNKITSTSARKLKAKKKYYVRVRTYKTVSGKKIYSSWSASKSVKTKK